MLVHQRRCQSDRRGSTPPPPPLRRGAAALPSSLSTAYSGSPRAQRWLRRRRRSQRADEQRRREGWCAQRGCRANPAAPPRAIAPLPHSEAATSARRQFQRESRSSRGTNRARSAPRCSGRRRRRGSGLCTPAWRRERGFEWAPCVRCYDDGSQNPSATTPDFSLKIKVAGQGAIAQLKIVRLKKSL